MFYCLLSFTSILIFSPDTNRRHVVASMNKVSDSMVDGINQGVARVFANQRKIGQETKYLENESMKLHKQTNMWIQLIEDFNNALKEIGDVENWAQVIENDMKEVSSALEHVYRLSNPSVTNTE